MKRIILSCVNLLLFTSMLFSQNPIFTHLYTADPTARVYNDTLFVYPSGDTTCVQGEGMNGFCMQGYNVFSTTDLTNWTDHGPIVTHNNVPWVRPESYGMWAPDCIFKDGKYYFYFPAIPADGTNFRNMGVAIATTPTGPFIPEPDYIKGITGIDPNVFVDDDGRAYLYYGGGETLYGVELNEDMVSIKGEPVAIQDLPAKYKEGPFVFKRNGIYYFTFPHAPEGSEEIAYAMGNNPLGPFEYKAKVLERWKDGCWTNHHSFVEYKDQWYLFYHSKDISGDQHLRSVCADRIYFNEDGTIPEIKATKRGISQVFATDKLHIDRYSALQNANVERTNDAELNWVVKDISDQTVIAYDNVEFDKTKYTSIVAYVNSPKGGTMHMHNGENELMTSFELPKTKAEEWSEIKADIEYEPKGKVNLVFKFSDGVKDTKIDWIQFLPKGVDTVAEL